MKSTRAKYELNLFQLDPVPQEEGKASFLDIPAEILNNSEEVLQFLQPRGCPKLCLRIEDVRNRIQCLFCASTCVVQEHLPYIYVKSDVKGSILVDTKRQEELYLLISPIMPTEDPVQPLQYYYWFFLACILSGVKHPNSPQLITDQGKVFQFEQMLQILREFKMLSAPCRNLYLTKTFPLMKEVRKVCEKNSRMNRKRKS